MTADCYVCHEEVADADGHAAPCNRPAVGWRVDPEENQPYPVCVTHHRWPYADQWVRTRAEVDDERAARRTAGDAADRFRDVLSECLGHPDENPGDDVLVSELRHHFGKTGPEPTRWRDFVTGARAQVDQINQRVRDVGGGEGE